MERRRNPTWLPQLPALGIACCLRWQLCGFNPWCDCSFSKGVPVGAQLCSLVLVQPQSCSGGSWLPGSEQQEQGKDVGEPWVTLLHWAPRTGGTPEPVCLHLPKGSTELQQSPANSTCQRPGGPKELSTGGVRLCPHFSSSGLTPRPSACATAEDTTANDFSMPTALGGYRLSWHLCLTHSAPAFTIAICLALHTCSLGVRMDLPGSLWTQALLSSPGLTAVCQWPVPPHSKCSPDPCPSVAPSQLQGHSTPSRSGKRTPCFPPRSSWLSTPPLLGKRGSHGAQDSPLKTKL